MKLCSIDIRFKLKRLIHTYRCTHALASSLLCQKYKLRSPSNSTHSTTRSQLTLSLCIPSAARHPGTISPLFTSTLLWNSLPSPIRSASSLHTFRQDLQKYLGIHVHKSGVIFHIFQDFSSKKEKLRAKMIKIASGGEGGCLTEAETSGLDHCLRLTRMLTSQPAHVTHVQLAVPFRFWASTLLWFQEKLF